jgi:[glutamine synthetase] adenylyltransferase / [glutamine synthetase]-adenylyl-L-tyrosine phosphorylase
MTSVPYTDKLGLLRQHYRHRVFASGVRDIMEYRQVYDSLYEMTDVADEAIGAALKMAGAPAGFAVLALGRLGTLEFDIASDSDLLFVRDEKSDAIESRKAAEQIVGTLSAYTKEGTMFSVDARLRPRGGEGELIITPSSLAAYFEQEAQAWEALSFTKLRFVSGDESVGARAVAAARQHLPRFAAEPTFVAAVHAMREKLQESDEKNNFKVGPGGFYDIDFASSYLTVQHAVEQAQGNIRERLYVLAEAGVLSDDDCATLDHAAELLRTADHVIRLVQGKARKSIPATEHGRGMTELLVSRILGREFGGGLQEELDQTARVVRGVYERVVRA